MKIKTGDKVRVLVGKDKGKEGKVLQVFPKLQRAVVEGLNVATKHLSGRGREAKGQKVQFPAPINLSNLALVSSKSGTQGRVGFKTVGSGESVKKVRVVRVKGKTEDIE